MRRKVCSFLALVCVLALAVGLSACAGEAPVSGSSGSSASPEAPTTTTATPRETVRIYGIAGPTGVGLVQLKQASESGSTPHDYRIEFATAPDEIVGKLSTEAADIAAIPTNLAANLYQKKSGAVRMIALNTRGVLSILENGNSIQSVADLKGRTIYSTGQGSNPEFILRHILKQNGIDPDRDVTLQFLTQNEEMATLLVKGTAQVALVPEPLATTVMTKNTSLRRALSIDDAWGRIADGATPVMGCLVVRTAFLEEHKDVVDAFLADYAASVSKAESDLEGTAALCEQYKVIASAAIAKEAIPRCSLTCITGSAMRPAIEGYFEVLFGGNPAALGGAMPDDTFYYAG